MKGEATVGEPTETPSDATEQRGAGGVSRSPAFQFYPNDFLGSAKVGMMEAEEIGAYVLLLCLDWQEKGFVFDEKRLAKWCRLTRKRFEKVWENIWPCFALRGDGRHYSPRLEVERHKQDRWRAKSAAGGKKGAAARWSEDKGGHQMVMRNASPNDGTPTPTPTPITTTTLPPTAVPSKKREPKPALPRPTWLTPAQLAWEAKMGAGSFPFARAGKALTGLYQAGHSPEKIGRHLYWYLHENDAQFASLERFAATFGEWNPDDIVDTEAA